MLMISTISSHNWQTLITEAPMDGLCLAEDSGAR